MTGWKRWGSFAGCALLILGTPECSYCAAFSNSARGTTGAQFLELPVGARAIAMGSAQGAAVNDATALYYNPAALAGINDGSAVFMHSAYFESMSYDYFAAAQKISGFGTFAFGAQYFSAGSLEETDNTGNPTGGNFKPADLAASLGYGRSLGNIELGAGMKYVSSKIQATATTFAMDLGARYRMGALALSGSLANLGAGLKFREIRDPLPLALRIGSSLELRHWNLALDLVSPKGAQPFVGLGVEYSRPMSEQIAFFGRLGYDSRTISSKLGTTAGMSVGGGLKVGCLQFDYALVPFGDLGLTHYLSAGLRWGSKQELAQPLSASPPSSISLVNAAANMAGIAQSTTAFQADIATQSAVGKDEIQPSTRTIEVAGSSTTTIHISSSVYSAPLLDAATTQNIITQVSTHSANSAEIQPSTRAEVVGQSYVVKDGDTLFSISRALYGNGSQWRRIYEANRDKIENVDIIPSGLELVIPDK